MTKGFAIASKDEGKGKDLFKSVVRNDSDKDEATVTVKEGKLSLKKRRSVAPPLLLQLQTSPELAQKVASAA